MVLISSQLLVIHGLLMVMMKMRNFTVIGDGVELIMVIMNLVTFVPHTVVVTIIMKQLLLKQTRFAQQALKSLSYLQKPSLTILMAIQLQFLKPKGQRVINGLAIMEQFRDQVQLQHYILIVIQLFLSGLTIRNVRFIQDMIVKQ